MDIDEVLRRLLLLGLPLVPLGCSSPTGTGLIDVGGDGGDAAEAAVPVVTPPPPFGCTGGNVPGPLDVTVMLARADVADAAAWERCVRSGDCLALCSALYPGYAVDCERVGGDAATDDDAGADGGSDAADDGGSDAAAQDVITLHVAGVARPACTGRRPEGFIEPSDPRRGTAAGRWLARAAALEGASIPAFRRLARELAAHGAPDRLVRAARAAVAEEARHFAMMARAARAEGVAVRPARVGRLAVRALADVARENAREGCVRETFGAMSAVHQARHAAAPALRAAFGTIARDEARHARLAWEVDAWARAKLPAREARRVEAARREEGAALVDELARAAPSPALESQLGLPSAAGARLQARRCARRLWAA
jgi:hypothetical protein